MVVPTPATEALNEYTPFARVTPVPEKTPVAVVPFKYKDKLLRF